MNASNFALKPLTPETFESFAKTLSCDNFLQSREMFARYKKTGREAYLLGLFESELSAEQTSAKKHVSPLLKAAILVIKIGSLKSQKIFSAPGGPILDFSAENSQQFLEIFLQKLKPFLRQKQGMTLQISPNVILEPAKSVPKLKGAKNLGEYIQCKWISALDLTAFDSPESLFKTFRKGHRYSIKYTDTRFHLKLRELKRSELSILKNLAEKAGEKHGFKDQSLSYYEEMFDAFGEKLKVLAAFYEGKPVAAAMFILYGSEIVYLYSGADPEYNRVAASYALQWHMLKYAFSHGFSRYNFYGVRPEPGNGVFEFKAGFRAEVEELWGTYMLPLNFLGKLYTFRKKYHKFSEVS